MFEGLKKHDISIALDELTTCFGVKEDISFHDLIALLRKKDVEGCVQAIANRLTLPISISLSYVPKSFTPGNTDAFHTAAIARTDWRGRGIESITAQVAIPQHLPRFGSSALQDYPIRVRVSENCHECPETFVAIMAHELSHVLLASLSHPKKDSELHTDLVPIILGFRNVVRKGRKNIKETTNGNTITTRTTTYGYLTDSQFDFACRYVSGILRRHQCDKGRLSELLKQVQDKLKKATRSLATFRDYFRHLDIHPCEKMRQEHAERVVQLHGHDYCLEWESRIAAVRKSIGIAEAFARPLNHYRTSAVERLMTHIGELEMASQELDHLTEAITKDERILRKYVGLIYRLRRKLRRHS